MQYCDWAANVECAGNEGAPEEPELDLGDGLGVIEGIKEIVGEFLFNL